MDYTRTLRVLHVVPALRAGGILRHIEGLAEFRGLGIEFGVLSVFDVDDIAPPWLSLPPVERLRIPLAAWTDRGKIIRLIKYSIHARKWQIVHSHHLFCDVLIESAMAGSKAKFIRTVHGITQARWSDLSTADPPRSDWTRTEIEHALRLEPEVDRTLVVSSELRQRLISYGLPADKMHLCYPGVRRVAEAEALRWLPTPRTGWRRDPVVAYVGRLVPVKAPRILAELASVLLKKGLQPKLFIAGEGPCLGALKASSVALGVQSCLNFVGSSFDPWSLLPPLDAVILTSISEGLPHVLLEAMARGIPVVAPRIGGIPEAVAHADTGFLYSPSDLDEAAGYLEQIASSHHLRLLLSQGARATVERRFSLSQHQATLLGEYRAVSGIENQ